MKQLIIVGIMGLTSVAAVAGGEEPVISNFNYGPYIGIHGGIAIPNNNMVIGGSGRLNVGPDAGAQVGYQVGNIRLEGAFTFFNNATNFNNVDLRMTTLMANGYYDFNVNSWVAPFLGVGLGWVHEWTTQNQFPVNSPENNEFAYQGIVGIRFHATRHFVVDVDYHRLEWSDGNGAQNLVETGLSYAF